MSPIFDPKADALKATLRRLRNTCENCKSEHQIWNAEMDRLIAALDDSERRIGNVLETLANLPCDERPSARQR